MYMKIQELHEAFCQYQETIKNYRPTTIKSYKETLKTFLRACPEVERIDEVSFLIVQKFFYWGRTEKKWMASTFITHHKRLNVFFKWAKERKFIGENPFELIEKPRPEKSLPKRLSKQEALGIIETSACLSYPHSFLRYRNHAIFSMFLYCGFRKSELLKLKITDVDLTNMVINIRQGKGNKDRVVPMPFQLIAILEKYLTERERLNKITLYFFVSLYRDSRLTDSGLKRIVLRIREASGTYFYIHMLRHTFATLMIEGGCDIYALSKMLGHNDIKTTTIYLSASVEHLRGQMTKHPLNFIH